MISARTIAQTDLVPANHELAFGELELNQLALRAFNKDAIGALAAEKNGENIEIAGQGFAVAFNQTSGEMITLDYGNGNLIQKAIEPNFWRAPTDNDFGFNMPERWVSWKKASSNQVLKSFTVSRGSNGEALENKFSGETNTMEVEAVYELPDVSETIILTYSINIRGEILIHSKMSSQADNSQLPRFGVNFILPKAYSNVDWYGRGPHENYQDRKTSARLGTYTSSVADLYYPYIRPQENGYKTEVRWMSFTDESGNGIRISAQDDLLGFSAHHQYNDDFDEGPTKINRHTTDIVKRDFVNVNVDYKQMGVGGDNSWGLQPHEQYKINSKDKLEYQFLISPVK